MVERAAMSWRGGEEGREGERTKEQTNDFVATSVDPALTLSLTESDDLSPTRSLTHSLTLSHSLTASGHDGGDVDTAQICFSVRYLTSRPRQAIDVICPLTCLGAVSFHAESL